MTQLQPRVPTDSEKAELVAASLRRWCDDPDPQAREDQTLLVDAAAIAVFDTYCTGGPGYVGKVMVVVWDGGPSQAEVYIWNQGTLERCPIDE